MYIYRELLARLIDHAPIDLSSRDYILFSSFSVFYLLAFLLLFWLGSAIADHRPHTPTTYSFLYLHGFCV